MTKRAIIFVSSMIMTLNNWAQLNLVPNYSFEDYSTCPTGYGGIYELTSWFQPNLAGNSSDAFNVCYNSTNPIMGVPVNASEYQYPKTGDGYAGINLFHDTTATWPDYDREYIEVELIDSLKGNKDYCIKFHTVKGNWSMWAIKNIQAVLTNDSLMYNDPNYGFIPGHIVVAEADSITTDTLNWIKVQNVYSANGGEKFLTIGNFNSGVNTNHDLVLPYNSSPNTLGYYLFDDVSVYQLPDYNAGEDDTICPFHNIVIGPETTRSDIQYSWSPSTGLSDPNIANPIASPLVDVTYILTVTDTSQWACNSILTDTINIYVEGCLGVQEKGDVYSFDYFPNPVDETLIIKFNELNSEFKLYNILGEVVLSFNVTKDVVEVEVSDFFSGIYFLEYRGGLNKVTIQH